MVIFVDTSAIFALLDSDDQYHPQAVALWQKVVADGYQLYTTNYVVIECVALIQRRLGFSALDDFVQHILPSLTIGWVSAETHTTAFEFLLQQRKRDMSLVDCVSFEFMRRFSIDTAFTFDKHFDEQGFRLLDAVLSQNGD